MQASEQHDGGSRQRLGVEGEAGEGEANRGRVLGVSSVRESQTLEDGEAQIYREMDINSEKRWATGASYPSCRRWLGHPFVKLTLAQFV